jgi:hypothetical protein
LVEGGWDYLLEVAVDDTKAGFGEAFGAHVAAGDGPLVVLLGEHGADQSNDRRPVGEDPDDVGAPAEFFVQPFLGYLELRGQLGP